MDSILIGWCVLVPTVLLVTTCLSSRCRKRKTREEIQRERFQRFYKKYMLPSYWGSASRVDFVRRPEDNLDTTQSSFAGKSDHTYEDISTPRSSKPDMSLPVPPRSPSIDKCCIADELNSTETETSSTCSSQDCDVGSSITKNWLQTPGKLASYISFRQTSHAILVMPSSVNITPAHSRENSDSDNNSIDYGSNAHRTKSLFPKKLNYDQEQRKLVNCSSNIEEIKDNSRISDVTEEDLDLNLTSNYEKVSNKQLSKTQGSWKTDPSYESIKSLTIPKIKRYKERKSGSGSTDHTYESLNSELCFGLGRADAFELARDDESDNSNFRRSFESVKSGRDFTVFEINCDIEDENDVFPENLSINSAHSLRHSYPGVIKMCQTNSVFTDKSEEEERYSPFPVMRKLSFNHRVLSSIQSPRFSMIQTISGNLKPNAFVDQEESTVLNTSRSVPKIKVHGSDFVIDSSFIPSNQIDKTLPDILENTQSVSEVFADEDDKIPPLKTYQTLRTIYSQARKTARTKKSLMSLPSVTEQTELELDQHLANNLYVMSTPLPSGEMTAVFSSVSSDI